MAYRATRTEVNEMFKLFCEAIGKRVAESWNDTGAWTFDYAKEYGGYVIQEIINDTGVRESPLGDQRYSATELVERMRFALRWQEQKDINRNDPNKETKHVERTNKRATRKAAEAL